MDKTEEKITREDNFKAVDLLQSCISRMAQNSFAVKGWSIGLVGAILALLPEKVDFKLVSVVCIVIIVCFYLLDCYYLRLEKNYRKKYNDLLKKNPQYTELFDLNPNDSSKKTCRLFSNPYLSLSVLLIYVPLLTASILFLCINHTAAA